MKKRTANDGAGLGQYFVKTGLLGALSGVAGVWLAEAAAHVYVRVGGMLLSRMETVLRYGVALATIGRCLLRFRVRGHLLPISHPFRNSSAWLTRRG